MATTRSGEQPPPLAWRALIALWPWLCAAISGGLLALCFPRWDQSWLCWLGLGPLAAAIWFSPAPARRWRAELRHALLGYVAGVVFFTITFWWLGSLSELFGNPWLIGLSPLLALYLSLYTAFWGWFVGLLPRGDTQFLSSGRNILIALLGAAAWVVQEWLRGFVLGGFGWNGLGVALHRNLAMIQVADLCGVFGLSFLVAFANLIAVITIRRFVAEVGRSRIRPHWDFSLLMAAIVGVFSYGIHALFHPVESGPNGTIPLRVAAIQSAIPEWVKDDPAREDEVLGDYKQRTELALVLKPQLILWPEASTPRDLFHPATYDFLKKMAAETNANLLIGSFLDTASNGEYNVAALFTAGGNNLQIYRKIHLVPFGEYVPLRDTFPLFARIAGDLVPGDLSFGKDYTVFHTEDPPLRIGPLICFEDTLGDLARRFVGGSGGADVLVNITNDSWFGRTPGAEQHLANAMFRAIENRRPLLRAANTGVTCFIDAEGRIIDSLLDANGTPFTEGQLSATVQIPQNGPITFYTRFGDWIVLLSAGAMSFFLLLCYRRPRRP